MGSGAITRLSLLSVSTHLPHHLSHLSPISPTHLPHRPILTPRPSAPPRGNGNRRLDHSNHFTLQIRKMGTKIPKCFVLHDVKCRAVTDPTVRGNVARLINHRRDVASIVIASN